MNKKIFENARFCPKGDTEANWKKAVGFVPLDKEIIIYKADDTHSAARFKVGDGKTGINDLPFSGTDIEAIQQLINEKGELLVEYVDNAVAAIIGQLDQKFDKSGGLIGGDLSVQGNLNVAGTTTTKDTETIMVKDNTIVANSNGNILIENAGFAVKTNTTDAYGIMYDPVGDGVKIGLGNFDENGKFKYTEGEDQFLATRADTIVNGHIPKWDDEAKEFVDSGVGSDECVKFTDIATKDKAGVIKLNSGGVGGIQMNEGLVTIYPIQDFMIKGRHGTYAGYNAPVTASKIDLAVLEGLTTNHLTLSDDYTDESGNAVEGEKTKACKWLGASTATNWRNGTGAGSVQCNETRTFANGQNSIAWHSHCLGKNSFAGGSSGGIWSGSNSFMWGANCGSYGDFAITFGNSAFAEGTAKKFTFLYGDHVKTAENMSIAFGQYNAYADETNYLFMLGNGASDTERSNALIVYKDGSAKFSGAVEVEAPQNDKDAVNKEYAEGNFVARDTVNNGKIFCYGRFAGSDYLFNVAEGATASTLCFRGANGTMRVGTPTEDLHAANKGYVDELAASVMDFITTADLWTPVHKEYTTILDTEGRTWDCDAVGYSNTRTKKHKVEYTLISTQEITANADNVAISVPLIGVNYTLGAKYRAATIAYSALPSIADDENMGGEGFKQSYFTLDGFTWDEQTDIGNECTPLPFRGSGGFEVKVLTWTENPVASITFKTIIAKVTEYEV